jgi:hypothetical protein
VADNPPVAYVLTVQGQRDAPSKIDIAEIRPDLICSVARAAEASPPIPARRAPLSWGPAFGETSQRLGCARVGDCVDPDSYLPGWPASRPGEQPHIDECRIYHQPGLPRSTESGSNPRIHLAVQRL